MYQFIKWKINWRLLKQIQRLKKSSDKENRREIFSPSTIQDIEVDDSNYSEEDIPKTREHPIALCDTESDR